MAWLALIVGLILLLVFPRRMGVILALAIAVGAGLYLYVEHRERADRAARDNVIVMVQYGAEKCPPGHPLSISIHNATDRTVRKTEFQLEVRRPGYSNNLIEGYGAGTFSSDRILAPQERHALCHAAPKLRGNAALKDLEYSVGFKNITFGD